MDKYLDENWKSTLEPYNDREYALKQLDQLRGDLSSKIEYINRIVMELDEGIDRVKCGLTQGHTWRLVSFDNKTYPLRKPPGVYKYECIHCGETIVLQANKKEEWKPFLKMENQYND